MNLELKEFQKEAVADLLEEIASAKHEIDRPGRARPQALLLSAPTASGKTVIMASMIEKILGGDGGLPDEIPFEPEPDAVFLWLSDQPELNRQSRARLLAATNRLRAHDLIIVGSDFDAAEFDGGKVFFLNSQKIGKDKLLTRHHDERYWTIWETIANTQARRPSRFYVIVDEAHRGMNVASQEREQANSIIQKFLVGSPEDGLPAMNLIVGLSATPERFRGFLEGTERIVRPCNIDPAAVRLSGLIKERIVLHPQGAQPSPWTLLAEACGRHKEMTEAWSGYAAANGTDPVKPALIVQIEDGSADLISRTPLGPLLDTLRENIPDLRPSEIVHSLQADTPLTIGGWTIRYAEPSSIAADQSIRVVLFKMALSTGWDCPRAEVMISFRPAQDATAIAQLVGRMVRTPLANRASGNEQLNEVYLFLPRYNEDAVRVIVERLTADKDAVPGTEVTTAGRTATYSVREDLRPILAQMRGLPSYTLTRQRKTSSLRRAIRLSRLLTQDGIATEAQHSAIESIVELLNENLASRLTGDESFRGRLRSLQAVTYQSMILRSGEMQVERGTARTVSVTARDVEILFAKAKSILTEEVAMAFWRGRFDAEDPLRAKLEAYEIALDEVSLRGVENEAAAQIHALFQMHRGAIARLGPERRAQYNELHAVARHEEAGVLDLPETIEAPLPAEFTEEVGHLFVDSNGVFKTKLNGWEQAVLAAERSRDGFVAWLRNMDRKAWALAFPYTRGGNRLPGYPDFIVVRGTIDQPTFDILEPHRGEDSVATQAGPSASPADKGWGAASPVAAGATASGPVPGSAGAMPTSA